MKQHPTPNSALFRTPLIESAVKRRFLEAKTRSAFPETALSPLCYKTFTDEFLDEVFIETADLYGMAILLGITLADALELLCLHWQHGCRLHGFVREPGAYLSFTMDAVIFGREGEIKVVVTVNDPMEPGLPFTAHIIYDLAAKESEPSRHQLQPRPDICLVYTQDEETPTEVPDDVPDATNS